MLNGIQLAMKLGQVNAQMSPTLHLLLKKRHLVIKILQVNNPFNFILKCDTISKNLAFSKKNGFECKIIYFNKELFSIVTLPPLTYMEFQSLKNSLFDIVGKEDDAVFKITCKSYCSE